jgi:hypothetical protein
MKNFRALIRDLREAANPGLGDFIKRWKLHADSDPDGPAAFHYGEYRKHNSAKTEDPKKEAIHKTFAELHLKAHDHYAKDAPTDPLRSAYPSEGAWLAAMARR